MFLKIIFASVLIIFGVIVPLSTLQGIAIAQKSSAPKPHDLLELGENEVKQLLLLIDANKNGKITKQEWMTFMEAEFDRLDKNKTGEIDAKELAQSRLTVSAFAKAGK